MFQLKPRKQGNRKVKPVRNLKERAENRNVKPFVIASLVCVFLVAIVLIHDRFSQQILFPITQVSVMGDLKNVKQATIKNMLLKDLQQGFFNIDLNTYAQEMEAINWVAQATLRRVWPSKLEILIREHQAVAVWDDKTLISTNGILFKVDSIESFKHLAWVKGNEIDAKELLLTYSELDLLISEFNLHVVELKRVKSGEMNVTFNSKLHSIFSLQEKETQFKRFVSLLESGYIKVKNEKNVMNDKELKSIDMRYSNGFSVVWQEEHIKLNKKVAKDTHGKHHV